jgi:hypothetical protein
MVFCLDHESDGQEDACLVDPRKVNAALHAIGTWCKLWWRTEKGQRRYRHILSRTSLGWGSMGADCRNMLWNRR